MGASPCKGTCGLNMVQANSIDFSSGGRAPSREAYKLHEAEVPGGSALGRNRGEGTGVLQADHCGAILSEMCQKPVPGHSVGSSRSSRDPLGRSAGAGSARVATATPRAHFNLSEAAPPANLNLSEVGVHALAGTPSSSAAPAAAAPEPPGNGDAAGGGSGGFADYGGPGNAENYWTGYFCREAAELKHLPPPCGKVDREWRRHVFTTGAVFEGQWLGNQRSGFGIQTWPDGAEYMGEWSGNTATGRGCFRHCDGDMYTGDWRHNMAHGQGVYHHRDGTTYQGEFVDDLQDGYGVESWPDRSQYLGRFNRGRKSGYGAYVWPDGSEFSGSWFVNRIDGFGTYVGADNRRFDGKWKGSAMHGCGRYCWPDGRTYSGQYVADQKDGFGTFTWLNGRRYDGYWAAGKQHGVGALTLKGAEPRLARWSFGDRVVWLDEGACGTSARGAGATAP